ncbi:MAG: redox-sensing transcriptional repressor Rex [Candidatus Hydrogenedentota bacterium]
MSSTHQDGNTGGGTRDVNSFTPPPFADTPQGRAVSEQTVARLSLYRRILAHLLADGQVAICSRDLGQLTHAGASQVRRDIMTLGVSGSRTHGYDVATLIDAIGDFLYGASYQRTALVGLGNLGMALVSHFSGRWRRLSIGAAFDTDTRKVGRVFAGVHCHAMSDLNAVTRTQGITLGIVAVPAAAAQGTADALVAAGVRGLVNFAPVRLETPDAVVTENVDMTSALEKVAYFARCGAGAAAGEGMENGGKPE